MLYAPSELLIVMAILSPSAAQLPLIFFPECECFQLRHGLTSKNLGVMGCAKNEAVGLHGVQTLCYPLARTLVPFVDNGCPQDQWSCRISVARVTITGPTSSPPPAAPPAAPAPAPIYFRLVFSDEVYINLGEIEMFSGGAAPAGNEAGTSMSGFISTCTGHSASTTMSGYSVANMFDGALTSKWSNDFSNGGPGDSSAPYAFWLQWSCLVDSTNLPTSLRVLQTGHEHGGAGMYETLTWGCDTSRTAGTQSISFEKRKSPLWELHTISPLVTAC